MSTIHLDPNFSHIAVVAKEQHKRENGIDYPADDFAYVPDIEKPSTWKLRLTTDPGKITVEQLGRAAAAVSPGGFRGQRADIPEDALSSVQRRIRSEYHKLGVRESEIPQSVKASNFFVFEKANGRLGVVLIYSNNIIDSDFPKPDIVTSQSHADYVAAVRGGVIPMPECWHWHLPGSKWGKAIHVDYASDDGDIGFAYAVAEVDEGRELEILNLAQMDGIGVSHGMYVFDKRVGPQANEITNHMTYEISPLPLGAAANKRTGIFTFRSKEMGKMTEGQKDYLSKLEVPDNVVSAVSDKMTEMTEGAGSLARKAMEDQPEPTPVNETPMEEPEEEKPASNEEIAKTFGPIFKELMGQFASHKAILSGISERLDGMQKQIDSIKVTKEADSARPAEASLSDLIRKAMFATPETNTSTLADKPVEKEQPSEAVTGVTFLDKMFGG